MAREIRAAIAGVGNSASSLIQGIAYYAQEKKPVGLANKKIGPYGVQDIQIVAAFDVDKRKVGRDLSEAIFQEPNNTRKFIQPSHLGVKVQMAQPLDGISPIAGEKILLSDAKPSNPTKVLADAKAEVLVNLTPTGATRASEMYARAALQSKCAFINATPARIASNTQWQSKYRRAKVPLAGDDIMDQVGSTILHRNVLALLVDRGLHIGETYPIPVSHSRRILRLRRLHGEPTNQLLQHQRRILRRNGILTRHATVVGGRARLRGSRIRRYQNGKTIVGSRRDRPAKRGLGLWIQGSTETVARPNP